MKSRYKTKRNKSQKVRLPQEFKKYFWDVDFSKVANKPFDKYHLERIMNYGNLSALKWLLTVVPRKMIKTVVEQGRELDKKTRNFWSVVYAK
jgi:hypothetical protein